MEGRLGGTGCLSEPDSKYACDRVGDGTWLTRVANHIYPHRSDFPVRFYGNKFLSTYSFKRGRILSWSLSPALLVTKYFSLNEDFEYVSFEYFYLISKIGS